VEAGIGRKTHALARFPSKVEQLAAVHERIAQAAGHADEVPIKPKH
jgi:hypothetical protein